MSPIARLLPALACLPLLGFGACESLFRRDAAPDMQGTWAVAYDDVLSVEITLDGAAYTAEVGVQGGTVTVEHDGQPFTFALDCADDAIVCPSEVWPEEVDLAHEEAEYPNRVWMIREQQVCPGEEVDADPTACGEGTDNPDCVPVCDQDLVTEQRRSFGLISEDGTEFGLLLGAGVASNQVNCGLLALSVATGDLVTTGGGEDWEAESITGGEVRAGYAGACLWAGDPDGDSELEAVALGATVVLSTGYTATRLDRIATLPAP